VVGGTALHPDRDITPDEHGAPPESEWDAVGLPWRHPELAPERRACRHPVNLGEDRLGDEEDELVGAPGLVKARRQALDAGEGAPEEAAACQERP
jgi:hypothetical protein